MNMLPYFSEYDTIVHFISKSEFNANHTGMSHCRVMIEGMDKAKITKEASILAEVVRNKLG